MTTEQPVASPASPTLPAGSPLRMSDVLGDALKLAFLVVSAGIMGKAGLSEPFLALLASPQLPSALIAMFGLWLFARLVIGTLVTARDG